MPTPMAVENIIWLVVLCVVFGLIVAAVLITAERMPYAVTQCAAPGLQYETASGTLNTVPPHLVMGRPRPFLVKPQVARDMRRLWEKANRWFDTIGIPAMMVFGTLLGAVRHHGHFIPWDDDMDVCIHYSDLCRLLSPSSMAAAAALGLQLYLASGGYVMKIIENGNTHVRFPFVDVFVVRERRRLSGSEPSPPKLGFVSVHADGAVRDRDVEALMDPRHVYPLRRLSLEGVPSWAPQDPVAVVQSAFGNTAMHSASYYSPWETMFVNHRLGAFLRKSLSPWSWTSLQPLTRAHCADPPTPSATLITANE